MDIQKIFPVVMFLLLTILSGLGDAQGFLYASKIWVSGNLLWGELARSALGYGFGITMYWFALRFLNEVKVVPPEVQTLGWFLVTIIAIALFNGQFLKWQLTDRIIAVFLLIGLTFLMYRHQ